MSKPLQLPASIHKVTKFPASLKLAPILSCNQNLQDAHRPFLTAAIFLCAHRTEEKKEALLLGGDFQVSSNLLLVSDTKAQN